MQKFGAGGRGGGGRGGREREVVAELIAMASRNAAINAASITLIPLPNFRIEDPFFFLHVISLS